MLLTWSEDGWVAIATDITKPQTAGGGKGGACKTVYSSNRELPISDVTYINWLNLESIDFQRGWDFTGFTKVLYCFLI